MQSSSGSLQSSPQSQGLMGRSLPSSPQSQGLLGRTPPPSPQGLLGRTPPPSPQGLLGRTPPPSPQSPGLMGPYNMGNGPFYFSPNRRVIQHKKHETSGSPSSANNLGQRCLLPGSRTDELTKPKVSSVRNGTECGAMTQAQESRKAKPNDVGICVPVVQYQRPALPSQYVTHNQEAGARLAFQKPGVSLPLPFPNWNPEHRQWHPWSGQPSKVITLPQRNPVSLSPNRHSSSLSSTTKNPSYSPTACSPLLTPTRNGLSPSTTPKTTSTTPKITLTTPKTTSTTTKTTLTTPKTLSQSPGAWSPLFSPIRNYPSLSSNPKTLSATPKTLSQSPAACSPLSSPVRNSPSLSSNRKTLLTTPKTLSQSSAACSPFLSPTPKTLSQSPTAYSPFLSPARPGPSLSSSPHSPLPSSTRPGPSLSSPACSPYLSSTSTACNPSVSPLPRRPVVGHQDGASQQHKNSASNEDSVPGGSTSLSLKRPRESESADSSAKKLCVQDPSCVPARSPVCTGAGQPLSPSLAPKPSLSKDSSLKTAQSRLHAAPASFRSTLSAGLVQTKLSSSQPPTSPLARQSSSPLARLYMSPAPKSSSFTSQYSPMNKPSFSPTHRSTVTRPPSAQPPKYPFTRLPLTPTPRSPLTKMSLSPIPKSSPVTTLCSPQPPRSPVSRLSLSQPSSGLRQASLGSTVKPKDKCPPGRPKGGSLKPQMPISPLTRQPLLPPVTTLSLSQPSSGLKQASLGSAVKPKDKRSPGRPKGSFKPKGQSLKPKGGSLKHWIEEYRRKVNQGELCPPLPVARTVSQKESTVEVKYQRRVDTKVELSPKPCTGYVGRLSLKHRREASGAHDDVECFTPEPVLEPATTGKEKGPPGAGVTGSGTFRVGSQGGVALNLRSLDTKSCPLLPALLPKLEMTAVVKLDRLNLENMRLKRGGSFPSGPFAASSPLQRRNGRGGKSTRKSTRLCQIDALKADSPAKHDYSSMPPPGSPDTAAAAACRAGSERAERKRADEDPLDLELGLSFELDMNLSQSSSSSSSSEEEEEQMRSMREIMDRITRQTAMPEPERSNAQLLSSKMVQYNNTLDQTLLHISNAKESKAIESRLLEDCNVNILNEEDEQEDAISAEHQEFLQRYTLAPSSMRVVHPGEEVFNLDRAGRIFTQDSLQPGQCNDTPQGGALQKTLLCSGPSQFRKHLRVDLPSSAYASDPCPPDVTLFLFKLMSVHKENMAATLSLNSLTNIAIAAARQRVKGSQQFAVWVPSLSELTLVFMNMGVPFVGLYPNETLQPSFTEGDVLEGIHVGSESPSSSGEPSAFPLHNFNYVLQYLDLCTRLCPRAYDDHELLLLLTLLCRLSLDVSLVLQPHERLCCLLDTVLCNVSHWEAALPRMCAALVELTADHHNMCCLVNMLPRHKRGQELRRHLSVCMISRLLDGSCTYQPTVGEFQLSALRHFLPRMRPSTLLQAMQSSREPNEDDDEFSLDMQSYYLCNSLLTLMNEASNLQFYTTHQKAQLLELCSELEFHVKSRIRESEKCLYRSAVKDLLARIYTRWQMLLLRTRPLNGQLYDYWKPIRMDGQSGAEGEEEPGPEGEAVEMEEEEEEEEEEEMEEDEAEEEKERAGQQG